MATETNPEGQVVEKVRYSDEELEEFRAIILEKLANAKAEYKTLRQAITQSTSNGTEDTSPSFKTVEDDGALKRRRASSHSVSTSL